MSCVWEPTLKESHWYEFKDRGAILPAGHFANGHFGTAKPGHSFLVLYGKQLPDWVRKFNDEKHYMPYINNGWDLYRPKAIYNESLEDNNPYEGKLYALLQSFLMT
jgi:hypothetical protein